MLEPKKQCILLKSNRFLSGYSERKPSISKSQKSK